MAFTLPPPPYRLHTAPLTVILHGTNCHTHIGTASSPHIQFNTGAWHDHYTAPTIPPWLHFSLCYFGPCLRACPAMAALPLPAPPLHTHPTPHLHTLLSLPPADAILTPPSFTTSSFTMPRCLHPHHSSTLCRNATVATAAAYHLSRRRRVRCRSISALHWRAVLPS